MLASQGAGGLRDAKSLAGRDSKIATNQPDSEANSGPHNELPRLGPGRGVLSFCKSAAGLPVGGGTGAAV